MTPSRKNRKNNTAKIGIKKFQNIVWAHYRAHGRDFAWRRTKDPYKILVSEIMLQQTQTSRVVVKYESFLKKFPTIRALAAASLGEVLLEWQGLGYNRRAMFLKRCAETIVCDFAGKFPSDFETLVSLPGIGPATAGDIMSFAWNKTAPVPFIETNIRSVFIHHFFPTAEQKNTSLRGVARRAPKKVSDKEILPLIQAAFDQNRGNPREWLWALFDYGAFLKSTIKKSAGGNPSRRSAHHVKQSPFEGSFRQKRAAVLRAILEKSRTEKEVQELCKYEPVIISKILAQLLAEGFVVLKKDFYKIK